MRAALLGLVGLVVLLAACPKKPSEPTGASGGAGSGTAGECAAVKPHVEALYRAEASAAEPKRVEEAVADNTRMVMLDCAAAPARVSACLRAQTTVKDLEATCLARLDEAGNPVTR